MRGVTHRQEKVVWDRGRARPRFRYPAKAPPPQAYHAASPFGGIRAQQDSSAKQQAPQLEPSSPVQPEEPSFLKGVAALRSARPQEGDNSWEESLEQGPRRARI